MPGRGRPKKVKVVHNALNVAQTIEVRRIANKVAKAKPEKKYFDSTFGTAGAPILVTWNGTVNDLSGMGQGIDHNGRIGDYIKGRKIFLSLSMYVPLVAAVPPYTVRVLVFRFKSNDLLLPFTIGQLLVAADLASERAPHALYNVTGMETCAILYDSGALTPKNNAAGSIVVRPVINCHDTKILYVDNVVPAAATNGTNKIYMVMLSDLAGVVGIVDSVRVWGTARFEYMDS